MMHSAVGFLGLEAIVLLYALIVVSPFAKPGAATRHYSTASIVKTGELLLGIPANNFGDLFATDLRDKVIQRMFAAGLTLQGAASRTTDGEVQKRIETSVDELDQAVRMLRDAIFGLEHRPGDHRLRQEVMELCEELSPAPEITFSGPVDGVVSPGTRAQLIDMLRAALDPIRNSAAPARIGVAAHNGSCSTVIEVGPVPRGAREDWSAQEFSGLRHRAGEAGIGIDIDEIPGGTRVAWKVPLA